MCLRQDRIAVVLFLLLTTILDPVLSAAHASRNSAVDGDECDVAFHFTGRFVPGLRAMAGAAPRHFREAKIMVLGQSYANILDSGHLSLLVLDADEFPGAMAMVHEARRLNPNVTVIALPSSPSSSPSSPSSSSSSSSLRRIDRAALDIDYAISCDHTFVNYHGQTLQGFPFGCGGMNISHDLQSLRELCSYTTPRIPQQHKAPVVGIVYLRQSTTPFEGGFAAAMRHLEETGVYHLRWINLKDFEGIPLSELQKVRSVLEDPEIDMLLVKSNFEWSVDIFLRTYMRELDKPVGLLISGVAHPPLDDLTFYDALFYETEWYFSNRLARRGHPTVQRAFGIDVRAMRPTPMATGKVKKTIDSLFIGSLVAYKRPERFAERARAHPRGHYVAVGANDGSREARSIEQMLVDAGVQVHPEVSQEKLAAMINAAHEVHVPSTLDGGGERAVLEAKACGTAVRIEDDNPKLQQLIEEDPAPSHLQYADSIRAGVGKMLCRGRAFAHIAITKVAMNAASASSVRVCAELRGGDLWWDSAAKPLEWCAEISGGNNDGGSRVMPSEEWCTRESCIDVPLREPSATLPAYVRAVLHGRIYDDSVRYSEMILVSPRKSSPFTR